MKEKVGNSKRDLTPKLNYACINVLVRVYIEFKKYLHGICDPGSRLLFKIRSGTHGLIEELGRHRGREGKTECSFCVGMSVRM